MYHVQFIYSSYSLHYTQLADHGKFVQLRVSAGARSKPSLNLVRNITSKQLSDDFVDDFDRKSAHAFLLLWMLMHRQLPDELSDDLVTWLTKSGIYQMNKDAVHGLQ